MPTVLLRAKKEGACWWYQIFAIICQQIFFLFPHLVERLHSTQIHIHMDYSNIHTHGIKLHITIIFFFISKYHQTFLKCIIYRNVLLTSIRKVVTICHRTQSEMLQQVEQKSRRTAEESRNTGSSKSNKKSSDGRGISDYRLQQVEQKAVGRQRNLGLHRTL